MRRIHHSPLSLNRRRVIRCFKHFDVLPGASAGIRRAENIAADRDRIGPSLYYASSSVESDPAYCNDCLIG
jgi:hypothetical protein